jgi:hypothetical protein
MDVSEMAIGYELEAGLENSGDVKNVARQLGFHIGEDGSVCCDDFDNWEAELRSPVYRGKKGKKLWMWELKKPEIDDKLFSDFEQLSHYVREINDSMGLHIHVSFKNKKHYQYLFSLAFVKFFQKEYARNFKKPVERDRMDNEFCEFYDTDDVYEFNDIKDEALGSHDKCDARCHSVNFNAYPVHKTIEFRIFPATKKATDFKRYVNFVTCCVTSFISEVEKEKVFETLMEQRMKKVKVKV